MADPSSMPPALIVALIAAGASLLVALVSALAAYLAQKRSIENQAALQRYQVELKRLQAELDDRRAERDARRDYEYEALKRMYQECSPLLFVLVEQAGSAYGRIQGLAHTASQGNLDGPDSWLTARRYRYYRLSTEYRLLAPLATLKLLQHRLTQFDLSLEPGIRLMYGLARHAGRVIGDDFDLAQAGATPLAYEPHHAQAQSLAQAQPAVYWQQGVPSGILDNAIESLLVRDSGAAPRVMSFLEFENARTLEDGHTRNAFERIAYLVADFHPRRRPVFWRVLLATASIYRALLRVADRHAENIASLSAAQLLATVDAERARFDWRADPHNADDGEAIEHAHAAVAAYLNLSVAPTVERDLAALAQRAMRDGRRR